MPFENNVLYSFVITVTTEILIISLINLSRNNLKQILVIILVNCITHPLALYFVYIKKYGIPIVEICVFWVEGFLYIYLLNLTPKRAFIVSFLANIGSVVIGIIIWHQILLN